MATTSSRAGTSARNEIIAMLKADHRKVKKAFKDFAKLDPEQDAEQCQAIVEETCSDLMLHMRLEEDCFYPPTREALDDADQMDEAEVEHASCKDLIEQLRDMSPEDEKWAARFTVLGEFIDHHVKEEETEMFPQASSKPLDWPNLLEEMKARRAELMEGEMAPQAALQDAAQEEVDEVPTSAAAQRAAPRRAPPSRSGSAGERAQAASDSDEEE